MKLVLVHGIHQEKIDPNVLREQWLDALDMADRDIEFPYYGNLLADLTYKHTGKYRNVASDDNNVGIDKTKFDEFAQPIIAQMRRLHSDTQTSPDKNRRRGKGIHKPALKKIARTVERISPFDGHFALKLLKQAYAYLSLPEVFQSVNSTVREVLSGSEPKVVVSHSLGTIVSYVVMLDLHKRGELPEIPLFLTLGSPLSLKLVEKMVTEDAERIRLISRWVNVADKEDFIALGNALDSSAFKMNIENMLGVDNGHEDPHSILKYLAHTKVREVVKSSLS